MLVETEQLLLHVSLEVSFLAVNLTYYQAGVQVEGDTFTFGGYGFAGAETLSEQVCPETRPGERTAVEL